MMMSHRVYTHTNRTSGRTTNLLISSNVHYIHLGEDNNVLLFHSKYVITVDKWARVCCIWSPKSSFSSSQIFRHKFV